jgi:predicted DNA-binding ribbon-helix-helix protein|tara:strand:- start:948 stop:1271 length:324 start_codon:yes stop_codon:yes gene_type:complete
MLKNTRDQRTLTLDERRTTLALENPWWGLLEYLAIEDGYSNWRDWFHENILNDWNDTMPLASHVRLKVGLLLVSDLEECKGLLDPSRDTYGNMKRMVDFMPKGSNVQ